MRIAKNIACETIAMRFNSIPAMALTETRPPQPACGSQADASSAFGPEAAVDIAFREMARWCTHDLGRQDTKSARYQIDHSVLADARRGEDCRNSDQTSEREDGRCGACTSSRHIASPQQAHSLPAAGAISWGTRGESRSVFGARSLCTYANDSARAPLPTRPIEDASL